MSPKLVRNSLVYAILMLLCSGVPFASAEMQKVYGKAHNLNGELEYVEEHVIQYDNSKIVAIDTTYYDAESRKIARQSSEFSHGAQFGGYDFTDERHHYNDGARVTSDRILIYKKENPSADMEKKYLLKKPDQIVGQGFYQFVAANLDDLAQGRIISAKLVLPAQMDQYDVRISKKQIQDKRILLKVELDNWFLRLFSPTIQFEYDLETRQVLWYRGVAMVSNKDRQNVEVVTTYSYPQKPYLLGSGAKRAVNSSKRN